MALTVEQRIAKGRMAIMNHPVWCLYSGLLLVGSTSVVDSDITAATNGVDTVYGRKFMEGLSETELRFLILHENEHKALRQISMYSHLHNLNNMVLNMAMDFVVNLRLLDADAGEGFITMPIGGCYDVKYRGWGTKQVFDDLMARMKQNGGSGDGKGDGKKGNGKSGEPGRNSDNGKPLDDHDFDGAEAMSEQEMEAAKKEIEAAIRQGGILAGTKEGNKKNMLNDVLDSAVRWQEVLAEWLKSQTRGRDSSSWSKIARRGVYLNQYWPSTVSETVGGLLLAGDASGSTWSGDQLAGFLGEAKAIIDDVVPAFVDWMWWDTSVQVVMHFEPHEYDGMIEKIKAIQGGGGTAPSCITDWIKEQEPQKDYCCAIVLSDGQVGSDWGEWGELPVLWCLNSKNIVSPVGTTLYCNGGY